MLPNRNVTYEFGHFRLIPAEHQLLRDSTPVPLPPKVFDTLVILVESGGRLIAKEELLKQIWPDSFVEEVALAHNISHLRKALRNGADETFIETVPRRGYRFVAAVRELPVPEASKFSGVQESGKTSPPASLSTTSGAASRWWKSMLAWSCAAAVVTIAGLLMASRSLQQPQVIRLRQITNSGRVDPWGRIVTDGSRIYFLERYADRWRAMQAPVAGGSSQPLNWRVSGKNFRVLDFSSATSQFLVGTFDQSEEEMPLWTISAAGNDAARLGNIMANDAAWSPDGRQIICSRGSEILLVNLAGEHRRIASVPGVAEWFSWSDDARRIRFTVVDASYSASLWEVGADGSGLHSLAGSEHVVGDRFGVWVPRRNDFLFTSARDGQSNLWLENKGGRAKPLTAGPNDYFGGIVSADAQAIFAPVSEPKADVVRYLPATREFQPFLPQGTSELSFSRAGDWIVFNGGGTLWRSRLDGSERLQIASSSAAPGHAPRISPDEKQVAFVDRTPGGPLGIYLSSMATGKAERAFSEALGRPDWSPDGQELVCDSLSPIAPATTTALYIGDLAGRKLRIVPQSAGLQSARWSPDGSYLSALLWSRTGLKKLMLFDFARSQWRELASAQYPTIPEWSPDGRYVYYQDLLSDGEPVLRIDVRMGKTERVVAFGEAFGNRLIRAAFLGLAPGEQPVLNVTRNLADIYALQVELP